VLTTEAEKTMAESEGGKGWVDAAQLMNEEESEESIRVRVPASNNKKLTSGFGPWGDDECSMII